MADTYNKRITITGWRLWLFACIFYCPCMAQFTSYNFRHLTINDGLGNGVIKSIAQDKYGYMWLATASGVCLYNGYSVKTFLHSGKDALSTPDNVPVYIVCDKKGNTWVSFENGLYRYNYNNSSFVLQPATSGKSITKMLEGTNGTLYCIAGTGLMLFNTGNGSFNLPVTNNKSLLQHGINDMYITAANTLYLATDSGLVIYQPSLQKASLQTLTPLIGQPISKLTATCNGNVWMSYGKDENLVLQTDTSFTKYKLYNYFLYSSSNMRDSKITNLFTDNKNRVWIATSRRGFSWYDSTSNTFNNLSNDPLQPMSLSSNHITAVYQDAQDFIWAGTEGYGVNYFNPYNNLFHAITPDNTPAFLSSDQWYRAAAEDNAGNLWLGGMNGLKRYNKQSATYTAWQNKKDYTNALSSNSVRSLLCDFAGYIWIGTATGLNRYNPSAKHMDFFGAGDAMPPSFYWSLMQDHNRNIWIGCREGLYCYNYTTNSFSHFLSDTLLSAYCSYNTLCLFEDSRQRIWIGTFNKGVIMLDRKNNTVKHWIKSSSDESFINNNIRSFAEDKSGTIWIATNDGLTAYLPDGNFKKFQQEQGLKTLNLCALLTDAHDRLWIGSGNGLFMLDSTRRQFTSFTAKDGLPSAEFNEQSAYKTKSGSFIYPALQGLVAFNPEEYKERDAKREVYIAAINVFNKKFSTNVNPEELKTLHLAAHENFFSLELASPNYSSPEHTWFKYRLEPFDKDWIYTKDRLVNYTNVPGGSYVFHYTASANKENWSNAEKIITIHIDTVFYRTTWFWLLVLLLTGVLVYSFYAYQIRQKEKIFVLQNKAQLLEKEKAVVMYENLKQQLNPHFLFNSLTSLRSLIRIDRQTAAAFLDKISMNYRYILKSSESELVLVKDELVFAQTYIEMLQTRFGKGLCVQLDLDSNSAEKKIVPVTIQNLIDNAIKHNALDTDDPLFLHIYTQDNYLIVSNNLQPREAVETSNRYGLQYLISLYTFLDKRPLQINKSETHFTVKIPLI